MEERYNEHPQWSILDVHRGVKIDEQYVFQISKNVNISKEIKSSCKLLHFTPEFNVEEVLATLKELNIQEYSQLFIVVIEFNNFFENAFSNLEDIKKSLQIFLNAQPLILQLLSTKNDYSKFYYKEETSFQFDLIDHQQKNFSEMKNFPTFLCAFLSGNFEDYNKDVFKILSKVKNLKLILRFLNILKLPGNVYNKLILTIASFGTKAEFLVAMNSLNFMKDEYKLSLQGQHLLNCELSNDQSVLLTVIENKNKDLFDYLIMECSHLIQQLPFNHQLNISTTAYETNQDDVLCDLVEIADFPFPKDLYSKVLENERLIDIMNERISLENAIKGGNFKKISEIIRNNFNIKVLYSINNNSSLHVAASKDELDVYLYLKMRQFMSTNPNENFEEVEKKARQIAVQKRIENVNESLRDRQELVNLLCNRSFIHNRKITRKQELKYRKKIRKWYSHINMIPYGSTFLNAVKSCDKLKIIFDFESSTVENASIAGPNSAGSTYPISKWIFIGAKFLNDNKNISRMREQKIKGVLAHELCHYVMKLVYENQESPYFKQRVDLKDVFEKIVQKIKMMIKDGNDECNMIISSVFTEYENKDFHAELIVRVVQILLEFDDDKIKVKTIQKKFEELFNFWYNHIIPDLEKYNQRNTEVLKLNRMIGIFQKISKQNFEFNDDTKLVNLSKSSLVIVTSNVPQLLLVSIFKYLQESCGNLLGSQNLFINYWVLKNEEFWNFYKQICTDNDELNIYVDCQTQNQDYIEKLIVKRNLNYYFVMSSESNYDKIENILDKKDMKNLTKMKINYLWSDLPYKTQNILLKRKVNFQNNFQVSLKDLLIDEITLVSFKNESDFKEYAEIFDEHLLNLVMGNSTIEINKKSTENQLADQHFELLYQPRNFIKSVDEQEDQYSSVKEKKFRKFYKTTLNQKIISHTDLIEDVKNEKIVLIADIAGNGKSWTMKNFVKILRDKNCTSWVSYVDLKQFIDEFKAQMIHKGEPEFATFMAEHILKLKQQFEIKIFQKLYKGGKVFILFDGFDEIAPDCAEFVSRLAKNFLWNGGNQLWITTRDYFEIDLRKKLNVKAVYRLCKISIDDGINFVVASWVLNKNEYTGSIKTKKDLIECLKSIPNLKSYQKKAREIVEKIFMSENQGIGLPQLFKMIADEFKGFEDMNDIKNIKVFSCFVKNLYERWSYDKGKLRRQASIESQEYGLNFWKFHQFRAIASLLPELVKAFFPGYDGSEWTDEKVIACGIMSIKDGKFYFLHDTFREFFVADFIAKSLIMFKGQNRFEEENLLKLLVKVLTNREFGIIQMFLNDVINHEIFEKIMSKLKAYFDQFYKLEVFHDYFSKNLENLAELYLSVLNHGDYDKVKNALDANMKILTTNAKNSSIFLMFYNFIIDFLSYGDFTILITEHQIFQAIIGSSLPIEVFETFVMKVEKKTSKEFVKNSIQLITNEGSIFCPLSSCLNLNLERIQKFLIVIQKYLSMNEIFELMEKCDQEDENIFQLCIRTENKINFKSFGTEIEKFYASQNFPHEFREFVKQKYVEHYGKDILHFAAECNKIELHKVFWEILLKSFINRDELMNFILEKDENGENFVHELISKNDNPAVIGFTLKVLKKNSSENQFQEILKSKFKNGISLLQVAACRPKDFQINKFVWKIFRDNCKTNEEFLDALSYEADDHQYNIFNTAASYSSNEFFKYMLEELVKLTSSEDIRKMLRKLNKENQNLLQSAVHQNESLELHKTLWETFKKYFEASQIIEFINHVDIYGDNILFIAVRNNSKEIVEFTWHQIKLFFKQDECEEYLKIIGRREKNLLQTSLDNWRDRNNVHNWIKTLLKK